MVLYFSGTGNSKYVAQRIGNAMAEECLDLFVKIKNEDYTALYSQRPWVVVTPTYAWRIPRIVQTWLKNTPLAGNRDLYFVMTCGGTIGNAGRYLADFCTEKRMRYRGCMGVTMPENYIALFSTPPEKTAREIIGRAEGVIDRTTRLLEEGVDFPGRPVSVIDRINSGIVNNLFYPLFVHARKFHVTKACISCGKCTEVCPFNNVRLERGKPVWGTRCTHCMACICRCPGAAIEYGRHSKGLPRYTCPK